MINVIGNYKEFLIIERETIKKLEKEAYTLLDFDDTYSQLRGREILKTIEILKAENIYTKDLKIKQ